MICETFEINRSSYYAYRERRNQVDVERMILRAKVKQVFRVSRGSAGSRTIKTKLNEQGIDIGRFKVSRLMAESDLVCKQPGPHVYKQAMVERPDIPNVLDRQFDVDHANHVWCGDIT
jgi:putative transposase